MPVSHTDWLLFFLFLLSEELHKSHMYVLTIPPSYYFPVWEDFPSPTVLLVLQH